MTAHAAICIPPTQLVETHKQALSEAQEKVEAVTEQLQEKEAALSAAAEKAAISDARIAALEARFLSQFTILPSPPSKLSGCSH